MSDRVLADPLGKGGICLPCQAYHPTRTRAARCCARPAFPTVPVIPGDSVRHSRPSYVPQGARHVPFTPRTYGADRTRWFRLALAVGLVLVGLAIVLAVVQAWPDGPARPATVPTTYGPPASTGGPVAIR